MIRVLVLAAALAGCVDATPRAPDVVLTGDVRGPVLDGARAWEVLGFNVGSVDGGLVECPRYWYSDGTDPRTCAIRIAVVREDNVATTYGAFGLASADKRRITLDTLLYWVESYDLRWFAAHEVGHVLLDAGHLDAEPAIMNPDTRPSAREPTDADLALACESIGVCL